MLKPKFIYFDVGGVLLHFIHIRQELSDSWGISLNSYLSVFRQFEAGLGDGSVTEVEVEAALKSQLKLDLPTGFYADCDWVRHFRPIPEMHQLVADLAPQYRLGLLTNVTQRVFEKGSAMPGMYPSTKFEVEIRSFEVKLAKPNPKIFELAIAKTGLEPNEILFVDDLEKNIQAAAQLGLQVFQFDPDHVIQKTLQLRRLLLS